MRILSLSSIESRENLNLSAQVDVPHIRRIALTPHVDLQAEGGTEDALAYIFACYLGYDAVERLPRHLRRDLSM